MEETESQIAKILLGNTKASSTYVYTMAEKADFGQSELYVVVELPLFNPAAVEACERICLAISSTLKRAYRKPTGGDNFETAISQINEELGKLASLGQTQWIDKLNCVLGVKDGRNFSIASCGKVSAFLLRNKEYTDISCSPEQSHPLKTFETFAAGKIRLGDLVILSTTQLFNHLSMDRLQTIVSNAPFLTATQTIIALLKDNADPQTSFGVLLNLQVEPGQATEEEVDLENYIVETPGGVSFFGKTLAYIKSIFALDKSVNRTPKINLPKISFKQRLQNLPNGTKNFFQNSKDWLKTAGQSAQKAGSSFKKASSAVKMENIKAFSPVKKFLLASIIILLIAVIANISIALRVKKTRAIAAQISAALKDTQSLLSSSQSSLLYKDDAKAANFLKQAVAKMPAEDKVDSSNKGLYQTVAAQLAETQQQMEKITQTETENLGSLGQANALIKLPGYFAVQVNGQIISYNRQNGKIEDSFLKLEPTAVSSIFTDKTTAAIYEGGSILLWDYSSGKTGNIFSQNVPDKSSFGGLAYYPTNKRVYLVDKKSASIISFLSGGQSFSKPVVAVRDQSLSEAVDISIDGAIYVLSKTGVTKFQNGKLANFAFPPLTTPLSGSGKIYSEKDFKYIYILDSGSKRILIYDKKASLIQTLRSSAFTKPVDFYVNEKNKELFLLNDASLLKIKLP